jgi:hypothetical protein
MAGGLLPGRSELMHGMVPTVRHLLDRRDLEFFRVPFPAHTQSFSLELWLRSVYRTRGDSNFFVIGSSAGFPAAHISLRA